MNETKKIIEVKNLCYSYTKEKEILEDVSFSVNKGEYVTLIGHNGSGKSTLAKLLVYILTPLKGEIYIDNELLNENSIKNIRNKIGIVFQNPDNQFIGSSVESDIAFGLENRNISRNKMKEIVDRVSKEVKMNEYLNKEPIELSGGQKQRVAIAGILALNLKIIIFDEATSMLDPEGVKDIRNLILEMKKRDSELTFISITHDIEECYLSDRVIILNNGKVFKNDAPNEVFKDIEELKRINLDVPFIIKLKALLDKNNIKYNKDTKDLMELTKSLCR